MGGHSGAPNHLRQEIAKCRDRLGKDYSSFRSCRALFPSIRGTRQRISFNILNRKTGDRTRYLVVDSETGDPVDPEDRVRGYEISKNNYVFVEDEEIDAVKIESTHTIDIDNFVPRKEIDGIYLDAPYYLAPDGKVGEDAFLVIREAMREKQMAGIARIVMSRRERMLLIEPRGKGLLATTLGTPTGANERLFRQHSRYGAAGRCWRSPGIIERKSAHFDPASSRIARAGSRSLSRPNAPDNRSTYPRPRGHGQPPT